MGLTCTCTRSKSNNSKQKHAGRRRPHPHRQRRHRVTRKRASSCHSSEMLKETDEILKAIDVYLVEETPSSEPDREPPPPPPEKTRAPRVGTTNQRSDCVNAAKAILAIPPPPPPRRCQPRPYERRPPPPAPEPATATTAAAPKLLMPIGPVPAPPIRVQIPGLVFEVPHFVVHVSHIARYPTRAPQMSSGFCGLAATVSCATTGAYVRPDDLVHTSNSGAI